MADISAIKLPDGNTYNIKDKNASIATNWVNGSATNSVRTTGSNEEGSSYTIGVNAVAEGNSTKASGNSSHAEGFYTIASGAYSHAEGQGTTASGSYSAHAEGASTEASGEHSHAEGFYAIASGESAHAEGYHTEASGADSHAEGSDTTASGGHSHAEGYQTEATNSESHAEGYRTKATAGQTHAEGYGSEASSSMSHAEGYYTKASGNTSHAEGYQTIASGGYSHAEGYSTEAAGYNSHAEGNSTTASGNYSHVSGRYNKEDDSCYSKTTDTTISASKTYYTYADGLYTAVTSPTVDNIDNYYEYNSHNGIYVEIVGNGVWNSTIRQYERSNARTLDWDGNEVLAGKLTLGIGPTGNMDAATKQYVDTQISNKADKATTLAGYGITDAKIASGTITLGSNTITPLTSSSTLNAAKLSGAIPSAVTATTQTAGDNSTKIATTAFVSSAISGLPTPMQFIGTVGTNGTTTWANLPAASGHNGYTYKVITAHTAETGKPAADVGDALISNGTEWVVIPAGDETATQSATTGISIAAHGTGTIIGVQSSTTTASKVTVGSHSTDYGVKSAGSASTWAFTAKTVVTDITFTMDTTDTKKLKITKTTDTVYSKSSGANSTAPTLGSKIPTVSASDVIVPIKNGSASTFVTGTTHTITDNGHTHSI